MASGARKVFTGAFTGVADDVVIEYCSFKPGIVKFWNATPRWGVKLEGQQLMDGANYLSSVGADSGVTITDHGFTVANGADINQNGIVTYFECIEGVSDNE